MRYAPRSAVDRLTRLKPRRLRPIKFKPFQVRMVAPHVAKRDHVVVDPRHSADKGVTPDPGVLMNGADRPPMITWSATDHVTAERGAVGHHHVIADHAIMADVDPDHEEPVAADTRVTPRPVARAAVHGDVLADDIVTRADFQFVSARPWCPDMLGRTLLDWRTDERCSRRR